MATALETYLGSKELKRLIVKRSFDLELPLRMICLDIGIDYAELMRAYINSSENKNYTIEEHKFEALLAALGINIRHQFVINENFDHKAKQEYLREVFKAHGEKKRTITTGK